MSENLAALADREKLIAEAEALISARGEGRQDSRLIRGLLDAFAAQPVLDESKLAKAIAQVPGLPAWWGGHEFREAGRYLDRALCETAKRGELSLK